MVHPSMQISSAQGWNLGSLPYTCTKYICNMHTMLQRDVSVAERGSVTAPSNEERHLGGPRKLRIDPIDCNPR
jgi:hypothetical protein